MSAPHPRLLPWASAFVLAALVLAAFEPAFHAGFVDWDDERNFLDNPHFRGFSAANLAWMATSFHLGHYQPLAWLSLALDHAFHGLDPRGYHVTNVLLHAAGAIAFLGFARRLAAGVVPGVSGVRLELTAFAAAAVFALHPLRVESVAWVTERRDVLAGLFFVLALDAWVRFRTEGQPRARRAAIAWMLVSLLAKAWGVVLPALFLVLDEVLAVRTSGRAAMGRERSRATAPAWILAAGFAALTLWAQARGTEARATLAEHGLAARGVQAAYALAWYPWKTLFPLGLAPIHALPAPGRIFALEYLLPAASGLALGLAAWWRRARAPAAWHAWLAFALTIAPVSGLLQAGPQLVAERYSYLACLPFALLLALLVCGARVPLAVSGLGVAVIVAVLVPLTRAQCAVWHDSDTLWRRAIELAPDDPIALDHVAQADVARALAISDPAERRAALVAARERFLRAFAASSNPLHLANAGGAERMIADTLAGQEKERMLASALQRVEAALAAGASRGYVPPGWRRTHGALLADLGRDEEAARELAEVVAAIPGNVAARTVYAGVLARLGRTAAALAEREELCRQRPESSGMWRELGALRAAHGDKERARDELERALLLAERARSAGDEALARAALESIGR